MIHALTAAALLLGQAAAAEGSCVTREQVGDIAIVLVPELVGAVAEKCRPHVAETAFLATGADDYLARLQAAADSRRQSAIRTFGRASGVAEAEKEAGEMGLGMFMGMLRGGVAAGVKPEACADLDRMLAALAPLPPENLGILAGSAFALVEQSKRNRDDEPVPEEEDAAAEAADPDGGEEEDEPATPPLRLCPA